MIELDFQYLVGTKINDSGVILDLKKFVILEKDSSNENPKWENEITFLPSEAGLRSFRAFIQFHSQSDISLVVKMTGKCPVLTVVLSRGIRDDYDLGNVANICSVELPKYYPMLVDPLLSFSAFLATIEIQKEFLAFSIHDEQMIKTFIKQISALQEVFENKQEQ